MRSKHDAIMLSSCAMGLGTGSLSTTAQSACIRGRDDGPSTLPYICRRALWRKTLSSRSHVAKDGVTKKTAKRYRMPCDLDKGLMRETTSSGRCWCQLTALCKFRDIAPTVSATDEGMITALLGASILKAGPWRTEVCV